MAWKLFNYKLFIDVEDIKEIIGRCVNCKKKKKDLEFAHISPTNLNGQGRGSNKRRLDVLKNKDKYTLLCKSCHKKYDRGDESIEIISIQDILRNI